MRRRLSRRSLVVQAISIGVVLVVLLFASFRGDGDGARALAAAPPPLSGGSLLVPATSASASPGSPDGGTPDEPDPIDRAIAPDGGVPFHPGATRYRSPFAAPDRGDPVRAKVGFLLNSVDDYDVKTGTFSADFFLSLTSDRPMPSMNLAFPNGKLDDKEPIADKPTFKLFRLRGTFKSPPDLRRYPFDSQQLKIMIEDDHHGIDQLRFSVDKEHTQLGRGFRALGWQVDHVDARVLSQAYPDRFDGDDLFYGRYIFSLGLDRFATSAAFKVFVPAFVIVLISLLGMWVPPEEMEVRSNAGAPMLAGAVLFHFALMQELPATSYLTRADKLMLGVYVSLAMGMISTWWMFLVSEEAMHVVFRVARWLVPVASVIVMALACLA